MSTEYFGVNELGIVVKMSELNIDEILKIFNKICCIDNKEHKINIARELLVDNGEVYLGTDRDDGVISHKFVFGNDIKGYFIHLIRDYQNILLSEVKDSDEWVIMLIPTLPSLFSAAYKDEAELIEKMKSLYSKYIVDKNFDYRFRLVEADMSGWG